MSDIRIFRRGTRHVLAMFQFALAVAVLMVLSGPVVAFDAGHWKNSNESSSVMVDHTKWAALLTSYLVEGEDDISRFRYGAVTDSDHSKLKDYLDDLQAVTVTDLNRDEQYAYWLNLYNALTIDVILEHYPVKSIRNIGISGFFAIGPWKAKLVTVEGRELSLDDVEHGILRVHWDDPRVHYGVNCASIGCPNLQPVPFTAENLNDLLDVGAVAYVNHPRGARVENGRLMVSSIYSWFKEDFGNNDAGIIAHLAQYADDDLKADLEKISRVSGYDYDWSLNGAD